MSSSNEDNGVVWKTCLGIGCNKKVSVEGRREGIYFCPNCRRKLNGGYEKKSKKLPKYKRIAGII